MQPENPPAPSKPRPAKLSVEVPYFYLKLKYWWYGFLFLAVLLLALTLASLGSPAWIETGSRDLEVRGGLLRCVDCPEIWSGQNYGDIADIICTPDSGPMDFFCESFSNLSKAGGLYIAFDIVSVLALSAWILKLVMYLKETDCMGRRYWLGYVFPAVAAGSHVLALILWASISVTSFSSDCEKIEAVCSSHGPGLALAVAIIGPLSAGGFAFIYRSVKKEEGALMSPPSQGPRQPAFGPAHLNESNKEDENRV